MNNQHRSDRNKTRVNGIHFIASTTVCLLAAACSGSPEDPSESSGTTEIGSVQSAITHPLGLIRDTDDFVSSSQLTMGPPPPTLPAKVDLSPSLPPPGDQGAQGSCTAWAVGYGTKSFHEGLEVHWDVNSSRYQFSPSWVYHQINGGSDGGSRISDAMNLITTKGADTLDFFPYTDTNWTLLPRSESMTRAARFKASGWGTLPVSVAAFKQVLAAGDTVVIGVEVFPDFDNISPTNLVYDSSAGTSRGSHALAIVGYDDAKQAFQFNNSWGATWGDTHGRGWLGYAFITDAKLHLHAYAMNDARNSAPAVHGNLYAVQGSHLHRVDHDLGDYAVLSPAVDWTGATTMDALNGSLYIIQNSRLQKVDPSTGSYTVLGGAVWGGVTHMVAFGTSLYVVQDAALLKVNPTNGSWTQLGPQQWSGTTSITAFGNSLYIIENSRLQKVNPSDGSYAVLGGAIWGGATSMVATSSGLSVVQGSQLYSVDPNSGVRAAAGPAAWAGTTSMTQLFGSLYIVENNNLHQVNPVTGAYTVLGPAGAWPGNVVVTAML